MANLFSWVEDAANTDFAWALDIYQDFHQHPELGFQEFWTSSRIVQELESWNLAPIKIGATGVGVRVSNGDGPVVMGRADIDGLPVAEITGLDYASEIPGVMHACGHDNHIVGLLGAIRILISNLDKWSGTFIGIFQPAEELGTGAQQLVQDGLTELLPKPEVVLGQHIGPGPDGYVGTRVGAIMSQADSVKVTLYGQGAHGSSPHMSKDPVVLAAAIILRLQTIISREVPPSETSVLTVASVHSGSGSNIIPDKAELQLNLRNYNADVRDKVISSLERVIKAECLASGINTEPKIEYFNQFPLTENSPEATIRTVSALRNFFGEKYFEAPQSPASEDFSDIANAYGVPYCYWFVSAPNITGDANVINHSPNYAPVPESSLPTMVKAMTIAALEWLDAGKIQLTS